MTTASVGEFRGWAQLPFRWHVFSWRSSSSALGPYDLTFQSLIPSDEPHGPWASGSRGLEPGGRRSKSTF